MATSPYFVKDPDAVLDYKFDWSDWLADGETITDAYDVTAGTGLSLVSDSRTDANTSVTVWLSGGTADAVYAVLCRIVTNAGRTDDRTIFVRVADR